MSTVADQFATAARQLTEAVGVAAVYTTAAGDTCSLTATLAKPEYEAIPSQGVVIAASAWEICFLAADLTVGGDAYEPQLGDSVTVSAGGVDSTYAVCFPDDRRYCWTWADRFQCRRKVFTKLTTQTPHAVRGNTIGAKR